MRIPRLVPACLCALFVLSGCSSIPFEIPLAGSRQEGSGPRVAVVLSDEFRDIYYETVAKDSAPPPGKTFPDPDYLVDRRVQVPVGRRALALIRSVAPQQYAGVEFLSVGPGGEGKYDLVLLPRLTRADASHQLVDVSGSPVGKGGRARGIKIRAEVAYELTVRDGRDRTIARVTEGGTGHATAGFAFLGEPPSGAFPRAFDEAQTAALRSLFARASSSPEVVAYLRAEQERKSEPAGLILSVRFDDGRSILPNNQLDADEEAELFVTVTNQGRGAGYGVALALSSDREDVRVAGTHDLGEIPPGGTREARLPVKAALGLREGTITLGVEARERRGHDARPLRLKVPTRQLERPSLSIVATEVNDGSGGEARGNGNGIPENGETVEILVSVKNVGVGPAVGTVLTMSAGTNVRVVRPRAELGTIAPGHTKRGAIVLAIPRAFSGSRADLKLEVVDGRGSSVASADRQIALAVATRVPRLALDTRFLSLGREVEEVANGQTVELEVVPRNGGGLDAEGVSVRIRSADAGVGLDRSEVKLVTLAAGAVAAPQRFEVRIPRSFTASRLAFEVEVSQQEFPSHAEEVQIPVTVRRPILVSSLGIVGRSDGYLNKNETVEIELRVANNGDAAAHDARAIIDIPARGIEVQSPATLALGIIEAGSQVVRRFSVRVTREATTGELRIPVRVAEADFPQATGLFRAEVRSQEAQIVTVPAPVERAPQPSRPVTAPVIVINSPTHGDEVTVETVRLQAVLVDESEIDHVQVEVNGKSVPRSAVQAALRQRPRRSGPSVPG